MKVCKGLIWHLQLNHASQSYLELAKTRLPDLSEITIANEINSRLNCKLGKAKHQPFLNKHVLATRSFQVIESDIAGPITPMVFKSQARYFVTFTDNFSRFALGYELLNKQQLHIQFERFINDIHDTLNGETIKLENIISKNASTNFTCKIGRLHTDNGGEYLTADFKQLLQRKKIRYDPCNPNTPQHNGISERLNLEIEEKSQTILVSCGMPLTFWGKAMQYVLYIHNCFVNSSIDYKTPYEMLTKKTPTHKNIRRFGCAASYLRERATRSVEICPERKSRFSSWYNKDRITKSSIQRNIE